MIDLDKLLRAIAEVEVEMIDLGLSRATQSKAEAFKGSLLVLEAAREKQGRNNS